MESTSTGAAKPASGYRAGLIILAALAAGAPAAALIVHASGVWTAAALLVSLAALGTLGWLTAPLGSLATGLRAMVSDTPAQPGEAGRLGAGAMLADLQILAQRLDPVRQRLTNRHPTTDLPTREPFTAEMAQDMTGDDRELVLGVVRFCDYDRLAAFDHPAAEAAVKAFGDRLRLATAQSRPLAQVERDCFAVWFRDAPDKQTAAKELQALAYVLGQEIAVRDDLRLSPELAVGAAVYPSDGVKPTDILTRAMAALEASQQARGRLAFFSARSSAAARELFSIKQALHGVASRDELILHYQPLADFDSGSVVGAEALLRWRHPTLGLLPPSRFIPVLEQSPLMAEVGLWVLNAACRQAAAWREEGLGDLKMAVNISAAQCRDPRLTEKVIRTLERHGLPPSALELELTETAALEDADGTRRLLTDLQSEGVGVALDDFGAGYSNLSYVKTLPISKLKIDRAFVSGVDADPAGRAICAALTALARGLGVPVLAEGVERWEEVQVLTDMGCRLFQGYLLGRPMEPAAFARAVRGSMWSQPAAARPALELVGGEPQAGRVSYR